MLMVFGIVETYSRITLFGVLNLGMVLKFILSFFLAKLVVVVAGLLRLERSLLLVVI